MILCRAESVPIVMSVPQKSLSMEPTIPTMWRAEYFWTASESITPERITKFREASTVASDYISDELLSQLLPVNVSQDEQQLNLHSSGWKQIYTTNYKVWNGNEEHLLIGVRVGKTPTSGSSKIKTFMTIQKCSFLTMPKHSLLFVSNLIKMQLCSEELVTTTKSWCPKKDRVCGKCESQTDKEKCQLTLGIQSVQKQALTNCTTRSSCRDSSES